MSDVTKRQASHTAILFAAKEEFEARPNYQSALMCASDDLDYIVGKYAFSREKQIQCGLNGCNRWHQIGFVLSTKYGKETHCGQDCGSREFDVAWDELEAELDRQVKAAARRKIVGDLLSARESLLPQALEQQQALAAACAKIRAISEEIRKDPGLAKAFDSALSDGGRILTALKVDDEIGAAPGQRGSNANITSIGTIRGGSAALRYHVAGNRFDRDVVQPLLAFDVSALESMTEKQIDEAAVKIQSVRNATIEASQFIESSHQFLTAGNLREIGKLREIMPSRMRTSRLDRVLGRLPKLLAS